MNKCVCLSQLLCFVAVGFTLAHERAKDSRTSPSAQGLPKVESDRADSFDFPLPPGAIARMGWQLRARPLTPPLPLSTEKEVAHA
jgi:hypothetical protein